jgi:phage repressor protein C with HTH and peptisase S24 domain
MTNEISIETQRFKQLRLELNLTQQAFADALELKGSIADIERGKTKLSGSIVTKLLQLYNVNPLWIYGESTKKYLNQDGGSVSPKVITLNSDRNENIVMVNVKAAAGYAHNLQDVEWYETLPAFELPLPEYRNATFRAFQITGDSMLPSLHPGEWALARAEEKISDITNNQMHVVVLADTVVVKKVVVVKQEMQLISLNPEYPVITINTADVQEIWRVTGKITSNFDEPEYDFDKLAREMRDGFRDIRMRLQK